MKASDKTLSPFRPESSGLPKDSEVSEDILSFSIPGWKEPSAEELASDPRLAHILGYED